MMARSVWHVLAESWRCFLTSCVQIFIEDVKSRSNGAFITDGECGLSQGVKSEPFEVNVVVSLAASFV
jgi:hypothetical protein